MKKAFAALFALLLGAGGFLLGTAPAHAAVEGTLTGWSGGHSVKVDIGGTTKSELATLINLRTTGGQNLKVYCIEISVDTGKGVDYTEGDFQATVDNPSKVLWVLEHGYPNLDAGALGTAAGVSGLSIDDAIAGTQVAVWHYSDGAAWNDTRYPNAKKVYDYLTGAANTGTTPTVPPSLDLSPASASGTAGERLGPFTITMSGASDAALTATGGATITDGAGNVVTKAGNSDKVYLTRTTAGSSTLTASATSTIETGRAFLAKGKQTLILAESGTADTTATAKGTWEKGTVVATIAAPTFTDGTCTIDNALTTPDVAGITWNVEGTVGWGTTVTVTAKAKPGYVIEQGVQTVWTHTYPDKPDCLTAAVPQAPQVTQSVCTAEGQSTQPTVTPATTPGITYQVSGDLVPGGTVVVTATPQQGYVLAPAEGWVQGEDGTASWTTTLEQAVDCGSVTPTPPTKPTPTPTGGGSVTPTPPTGGSTTPGSGGTLPHTGGDGMGILTLGLAALAGGALLLLAGRRMRGTHQR